MMFKGACGYAFMTLFLVAGCPKPNKVQQAKPDLLDEKDDRNLPPAVPAEVVLTQTSPADGHAPNSKSPLIDYMSNENSRWKRALSQAPVPAYFIGYRIQDQRRIVIEGEGGAILFQNEGRDRYLDVEVRVGTPKLDSRHSLRDQRMEALTSLQRVGSVPRGTDEKGIKTFLWLETDRRYREALARFSLVLNQQRVAGKKDEPDDFSVEKPEIFFEPAKNLSVDQKAWAARIRACSKRANVGIATRASCRVEFDQHTLYYVNSEGTQLQRSWITSRFIVSVGVKAQDGQGLSRTEQRFATSPDKLPSPVDVDTMIKIVNDDLDGLHDSPVVDPYVGPAILEGRAAAVFFHEVFGHRIEGHRQKGETSGQTFSSKVGERIMPEWLTVYDDPTVTALNGTTLNGFYRFDDEGVRAQKASLVESGSLKGFIQGRDPIKNFGRSNGHGRKEPGLPSVSRQGNLVVETKRSVTKKELREQLIAEVKKQGKPYGMLFTDIAGGFTNTSRLGSQSFEVTPVMAYRIYVDGREELVRGVDIVGTPLTALGSIISAARPMETFNGMCGAESGWVPVSASAPSLLLTSLEVERSFQPNDQGPVLDPPSIRKVTNNQVPLAGDDGANR